jgi:hypothetical protein
MILRFPSSFVVLLGTVLIVVSTMPLLAQAETTTTQNPFGGGEQPTTAAPKRTGVAASPKAGQFTSEADARASCPGDTVVWANTSSKIFHHAGDAAYGKTKRGAYMCEKDTASAGIRAAKNEKRK